MIEICIRVLKRRQNCPKEHHQGNTFSPFSNPSHPSRACFWNLMKSGRQQTFSSQRNISSEGSLMMRMKAF
jgi:hypothetical protein